MKSASRSPAKCPAPSDPDTMITTPAKATPLAIPTIRLGNSDRNSHDSAAARNGAAP